VWGSPRSGRGGSGRRLTSACGRLASPAIARGGGPFARWQAASRTDEWTVTTGAARERAWRGASTIARPSAWLCNEDHPRARSRVALSTKTLRVEAGRASPSRPLFFCTTARRIQLDVLLRERALERCRQGRAPRPCGRELELGARGSPCRGYVPRSASGARQEQDCRRTEPSAGIAAAPRLLARTRPRPEYRTPGDVSV
jgi:hypothetical protein